MYEEFQHTSENVVSLNIIRKETHLLGYHRRATAYKPMIKKSNSYARRQWNVEQ